MYDEKARSRLVIHPAVHRLDHHLVPGADLDDDDFAPVTAPGALAMKYLAMNGIFVSGRIVSVHGKTEPTAIEAEILGAKNAGDSVGGIAEIVARAPVDAGRLIPLHLSAGRAYPSAWNQLAFFPFLGIIARKTGELPTEREYGLR